MTETQAMSETAGAPASPVEKDGGDAASSTGRAAVGRATVPADQSEPTPARSATGGDESAGSTAAAAATTTTGSFTRPAGMPVPDSEPTGAIATSERPATATGRAAAGSATLRSVVNSASAGAVRVTEAVRAARTSAGSAASRGPRRARLSIKRIDPWSVMKFSFAVSFVLLVVIVVATSVLYLALDAMGVFNSLNTTLADLFASNGSAGDFRISASAVIGTSAILGAINVVLFTALMTLGAFIYNVCADLVGGVEITLAERD
ncbi:hypothetical protein Cme02nite_24990 [Catellatospora methionotrophica]|uniref:DUF3566 domain-containing protein n=1 Tax=Catellatospora methionotrophica TaxID=121620 RepID=A0A8J3L8D0_9ACTN|nr:DUF3566 domain-containing protein [Catellatospora methionotrophica]GIG14167.1 hypothetical protein Cme02nite_24990 [Catellatospora methionotrophica]